MLPIRFFSVYQFSFVLSSEEISWGNQRKGKFGNEENVQMFITGRISD
jgi:hypothetical protein